MGSNMSHYILAIDQGTTSTRSMIFDENMKIKAQAQEEFTQYFPQSGWVEHDPEEIWNTVLSTMDKALSVAGLETKDIAGIGITNQRETTVIWDRKTGKPIFNAIVWQDRRTSDFCTQWREEGAEPAITNATGLLIDPYFSSTKIKWVLDQVEGSRARAAKGELAFGTIDSFLIWRLTQGRSHVTDATNAARTMLYDIGRGEWSEKICARLGIPMSLLPEVRNCADDFGHFDWQGVAVPILGVAGDQQAATIGQACFEPGMVKSTYGTGCFALMNTGAERVQSQHRLLSTIAYQLDGEVTYALEGSIFIAGAVVQWLRDGLGLIDDAGETQALAEAADEAQNVTIVPAFTGLGAPYWNADVRGAIFGLTRGTTPKEMARAALQSVGLQTNDLLMAMSQDMKIKDDTVLRVDGGMSSSAYAMQFLSDVLEARIERPEVLETTVVGVAWLAGQRVGIYPQKDEFAKSWQANAVFEPKMEEGTRQRFLGDWARAVKACMAY